MPEEQATQVLPATEAQPAAAETPPPEAPEPVAPVRDLPAGIDPNELATAPAASASRGKLRRRLRYLRAVRDLLLRDLGGFTYEIHRSAGDTMPEPVRKLAESKTRRLDALDAEVRGLEAQLAEPHSGAVLREPGVGGLCPECGELHASDAHYCSRCGAPLTGKARAKRDAAVAAAAQPTTGAQPTVEPAPASVLWAGGPHPKTPSEPDKETTEPSVVTNEWLALPKRPDDAPAATRPAAKAEPAAATDEPATNADETRTDEPATTTDETTPDEPAHDDDATTRLDAVDDKPAEDFQPNGRREADVPAPETLGDPLSSRREQGP